MRIIDVHTHILSPDMIVARQELCKRDRWFGLLYANPRARLADAADLIASMDKAGIDKAVVFGFAFADQGLCQECNAYVLQVARQYPDRVIPFAVVNPCAREIAVQEAHHCLELGFGGIGELMPDGQGFTFADTAFLDPLLDLTRHYQVPVMLHVNELLGHVYAGKGSQGPQQAFELAVRRPENVFILAHWGGGLPFYELMPKVRVALRNVYYDTAASPYLYEDSAFRHVMAWAPTKVLFGSDYPLLGQMCCLKKKKNADLDEKLLAQVLGGNALTILRRGAEQELMRR